MHSFFSAHGKHCYLRSFKTSCPKCKKEVLYWECKHGCKVFFEYPPYGKLVKHFCKLQLSKSQKIKDPIIIKRPKFLFEKVFRSCPICGKFFNNENNLKDHLKNLEHDDPAHQMFFKNQNFFNHDNLEETGNLNPYRRENIELPNNHPKFGRINIKNKIK